MVLKKRAVMRRMVPYVSQLEMFREIFQSPHTVGMAPGDPVTPTSSSHIFYLLVCNLCN
jgi:hypothetical protein